MSEAHTRAALRRGHVRTSTVESKVREAMRLIQEEMTGNGGTYPQNGGVVSKNEVARRAGISDTTLYSPKQKDFGKEVQGWVDSLNAPKDVEPQRVRRTASERSEDWRKRYLALQDQHILVELELQDTQVQLEAERKAVAELSEKYEILLNQIRSANTGNVAALPIQVKR